MLEDVASGYKYVAMVLYCQSACQLFVSLEKVADIRT